MDMEFPAGSGTTTGNGPVINASTPAMPMNNAMPHTSGGMRPTTAAAVANEGEMLGTGGLVGEEVEGDEYEDHGRGDHRPNTAGAMLSGYNRGQAQQAPAASWGYSREGQLPHSLQQNSSAGMAGGAGTLLKDPRQAQAALGSSGGIAGSGIEYTDGQNRRPHTAHGARGGGGTGAPSGAPSGGSGYAGAGGYNEGEVC